MARNSRARRRPPHTLTPARRLVKEESLGASGLRDHPAVRGEDVTAGGDEAPFHRGNRMCAEGYGEAEAACRRDRAGVDSRRAAMLACSARPARGREDRACRLR
jgi:hypothetical protein